jgi:hypothetical protein
VVFIATIADGNIGDDTNVKERYEAGTLGFTDADGNRNTTVYYNTGNILKTLSEICGENGTVDYSALFTAWLARVHAGASDINAQGFPVTK